MRSKRLGLAGNVDDARKHQPAHLCRLGDQALARWPLRRARRQGADVRRNLVDVVEGVLPPTDRGAPEGGNAVRRACEGGFRGEERVAVEVDAVVRRADHARLDATRPHLGDFDGAVGRHRLDAPSQQVVEAPRVPDHRDRFAGDALAHQHREELHLVPVAGEQHAPARQV
jgi:hypothetical protein